MKQGKSEVIIVLDRSGSMSTIKSDMEGGFKTFLDKQKAEPGECFVSLYQFDNEYEAVFENKNINEVNEISLTPRGMTALLDAIGKTTNSVGERLAKTPEEDRPETVIVAVITDGLENSSREFSREKVKELVEHQSSNYNWRYVFMGANQDAIFNGKGFGFSAGTSLSYGTSNQAISGAFQALASGVSCMRSYTGVYSFSKNERSAAMGANIYSVPNP